MSSRIVFLPLSTAAIVASSAHAVTYFDVGQAQTAIFPGRAMTSADVKLTPEQRKAIEQASGVRVRSDVQKVWRVNGGGWFIVDEVLGKHEFITWAIGLNADGSVKGLEIMEYRETYGYEVRDAKWRAQFSGKTKAAPLQLDKDIKNISGATLSSRHMAEGVRRILALHDIVLR